MKHREHRLGVSKNTLVTRNLVIEPNESERIEEAVYDIDQLYGMDEVSYEGKHRHIRLAYDASRLCIDDVEKILESHGVDISSSRWNRFKEEYYRFVDQNIKDNAKKEPWSCH
ncbi:cation transporter [Halomonas sp. ZH2S]|uniref:Cation transporter n=1 Tax=Vreelandella zhuhanensis TaxID=2684210 RepID=A0A7X3H081_9GAMM|nr:cation transporter [Halomonas zhuhanensis]MWJ28127.1 cation transporter [Halomonas zhuhanensis]